MDNQQSENGEECGMGCVGRKQIHAQLKTIERAREGAAQPETSISNACFTIAAQEARRQEADMAFLINLLSARHDELKAAGDTTGANDADELLKMLGADIHDPARGIAAKIVLLMGALIAQNKEQQMAMAGKLANEKLMAFGGSLNVMRIDWALRKSHGNQTEAAKLAGLSQGRISQVFNEKIAPFFKRLGFKPEDIYNPADTLPPKQMPGWSSRFDTDNISDPAAPLPSDYEQNEPLS